MLMIASALALSVSALAGGKAPVATASAATASSPAFVQNLGQFNSTKGQTVYFYAQRPGLDIFLTNTGLSYVLQRCSRGSCSPKR